MSKANLFETDDIIEGVRSLQLAASQLELVTEDPYHWKWVIVAVHNAVQAFMVSALRDSVGLNILTKKSQEEWVKAESEGREPRQEHLNSFLALYSLTKGSQMERFSLSRCLPSTPEQDAHIVFLNSLRNQFAHFLPATVLMHVMDFVPPVEAAVGIIGFLALESGNILWTEDSQKPTTENALLKIRQLVLAARAKCRPDLVNEG